MIPNLIYKDGQLYSADHLVLLDHKPMVTQKGTLLSFENLDNLLYTNTNGISMSSYNELEHFNDYDYMPYDENSGLAGMYDYNYYNMTIPSNNTINNGTEALEASGNARGLPANNTSAGTLKRPYISSTNSLLNGSYTGYRPPSVLPTQGLYSSYPNTANNVNNINVNALLNPTTAPALTTAESQPISNNTNANPSGVTTNPQNASSDIYICSMPPQVNLGHDNVERHDYIHINVKGNTSAFAVIPINKSVDTLSYVRKYIESTLWNEFKDFSFNFLSKTEEDIYLYQEPDIKVVDHLISEEWVHHTFHKTFTRDHLFIHVHYNKDEQSKKRKRGNNNEDGNGKKEGKTTDQFKSEFTQQDEDTQFWCAWNYFNQCNYNSTNNQKETLLSKCVEKGNSELCNFLISRGADVNYCNTNGESLLHIAAKKKNKSLCMLLLSLIWRKNVVLGGYPNLRKMDLQNREPYQVCEDHRISELIKACSDRYRIVNVMNLTGKETLCDIRKKLITSSSSQESIRQAKFIYLDTVIFPFQEHSFYAADIAINSTCFIIYIPPTQYSLNQIGINLQSNITEKKALDLLTQSLSSLSLNTNEDPLANAALPNSTIFNYESCKARNYNTNYPTIQQIASMSNSKLMPSLSYRNNNPEELLTQCRTM